MMTGEVLFDELPEDHNIPGVSWPALGGCPQSAFYQLMASGCLVKSFIIFCFVVSGLGD